jgi:4-amino-4-deoxy-L-arabinose transferase-like glycosyltransferase
MGLGILAKGPVAPALVASAGAALWALGRRWTPWQLAAAASLAVCGWWLGPVVLAIPAAVAVVAAARSPGARRTLARLRPAWGMPLMLAVVLPWTVAAWQATEGEFLRVAIGRHVVERSLEPMESHGGFPGFYLLTAVVAAFPWMAMAPRAVGAATRRWRSEPELRFRVAWLLGWLVVVEMVRTKLVHYWLPAYPAGILLVAWLLWSRPGSLRVVSRAERAALVVGALVLAGAPVAASLHLGLDALLPRSLLLALPLLAGAAALAVGRPRSPRAAVGAASLAGLLFLLGLVAGLLPSLGELGLGRRSAAALLAEASPGDSLVVLRMHDDEILFDLPLDAEVWSEARCPEEGGAVGGGVLVGRDRDLAVLESACPGLGLEQVARVHGLDLGHGRWATASVARWTSRRRRPTPPAGEAP